MKKTKLYFSKLKRQDNTLEEVKASAARPISLPTRAFSFLALSFALAAGLSGIAEAQTTHAQGNDSNTPLHAMQPDYPVPYGKTTVEEVTKVLTRVHTYLEAVTPTQIVNRQTGAVITDFKKFDKDATIKAGDFRLASYEWGVTYVGMLQAGEATGDARFTEYTAKRIKFLADMAPYFREQVKGSPQKPPRSPMYQVLDPHALDDAGAMCAAMIRAQRAGVVKAEVRPLIDNYINYISNKEFRLSDGTLARNRPLPNTIWLDDLFMSVPALAQMGKLTGEQKYYDDAVKQVLQFSKRMFNKEKGVYMHGWVESMADHPQFHWARANGWAVMTMVEVLDVLPENHAGRAAVLDQLRTHIRGLSTYQSGVGFWHQLLDRNDSYLETSATAIYVYAFAKAINRGWIDPLAYGPVTLLGWNAVASKVNAKGQVEGTCVGTGMGFEPAFYYYRPISVYAAHGYGPVLLAGAEVINLLKKHPFTINDSAVQFSLEK